MPKRDRDTNGFDSDVCIVSTLTPTVPTDDSMRHVDGSYLLFDHEGRELIRGSTNEVKNGKHIVETEYDMQTNLAFLISCNGQMLNFNNPHFTVFKYSQHRKILYAPARCRCTYYSRDDHLLLEFDWLIPDTTLKCREARYKLETLKDLESREGTTLPLSAIVCNLNYMSHEEQQTSMPQYQKVLAKFNKLLCTAGETFVYDNVQIANYLEFYFIKPEWIWRSQLGQYMWLNFVKPNLRFGRMDCWQKACSVFTMQNITSHLIPTSKTMCFMCNIPCQKVHEVVLEHAEEEEAKHWQVDTKCNSKLLFLNDIRIFLQTMRQGPLFDASKKDLFVPFFKKCFQTMHDISKIK